MPPRRQAPIEVFEDNIEDARQLIELTRALTNRRKRRMRRELREGLGAALGVSKRERDGLDCIESEQAFLILKARSSLDRDRFDEDALRPLLRQAVVAIAAAVESYVADRACQLVSSAMNMEEVPRRLREMPISIGDVSDIERNYERRKWGYRGLVEQSLRQQASAAPNKVGIVFSTVGVSELWRKVDTSRGVKKGTSVLQLETLANRRNDIAHAADRSGSGRAALSGADVEAFYKNGQQIVEAIDQVVEPG